MAMWVYDPHSGGVNIPPAVRARTERRIHNYADKHYAGKFTQVDVRFRGALCYIDVYTEPDETTGRVLPRGETRDRWLARMRSTPTHLCRIRYFGDENRWSFAWFTYSNEKYEPSFLNTGEDHGTPEEAFETSAHWI